ncbi:MAG TPA: ribonuclease III [Peptococcaceae bacterium]|nr:ribonuclease III [Peptococcaceae bacterium]
MKTENYREKLERFQERLGIRFGNLELLECAFTHPSYAYEHFGGKGDNQRLEFLGDAVLGLAVADYLYHHYPQYPEGRLTKIRAAVVCEQTLAKVAQSLGIGDFLRLGKGEELTGGRERSSNLAEAFEALAGAIFLDRGWEKTRQFLHCLLKEEIEDCASGGGADYKTLLQEFVQGIGKEKLSYVILSESGPDHDKRFVAGVVWKNRLLGRGEGRSKKEAEQQAAREALEKLKNSQLCD